MDELNRGLILFKLDKKNEHFEEIENIQVEPASILDSNSSYIIVDSLNKYVWIWHGSYANIRMKFITTQEGPNIRNTHGIDYDIKTIDQGNEPEEFKSVMNLE
jgi:hypothetical protein